MTKMREDVWVSLLSLTSEDPITVNAKANLNSFIRAIGTNSDDVVTQALSHDCCSTQSYGRCRNDGQPQVHHQGSGKGSLLSRQLSLDGASCVVDIR